MAMPRPKRLPATAFAAAGAGGQLLDAIGFPSHLQPRRERQFLV